MAEAKMKKRLLAADGGDKVLISTVFALHKS